MHEKASTFFYKKKEAPLRIEEKNWHTLMIIDGKKIAEEIEIELQNSIARFAGRPPRLTVILVGSHPASELYVKRKQEACKRVGIESELQLLPSSISEEELLKNLRELNGNPLVDAILLQLPLPPHIHPQVVTQAIDPQKDVDGFTPYNLGKLLMGETDGFIPCTPLGIKVLLERSSIELSGRHVVILGRSNIVGKPLAALLMQPYSGANATVTVAHSQTKNLADLTRSADVLIVAIGKPLFLKAESVKEGAVVVDVGINKIGDPSKKSGYAMVGDVDFNKVAPKCAWITPVPGGVGPMTIAMLLQNTWKSYSRKELGMSLPSF